MLKGRLYTKDTKDCSKFYTFYEEMYLISNILVFKLLLVFIDCFRKCKYTIFLSKYIYLKVFSLIPII